MKRYNYYYAKCQNHYVKIIAKCQNYRETSKRQNYYIVKIIANIIIIAKRAKCQNYHGNKHKFIYIKLNIFYQTFQSFGNFFLIRKIINFLELSKSFNVGSCFVIALCFLIIIDYSKLKDLFVIDYTQLSSLLLSIIPS